MKDLFPSFRRIYGVFAPLPCVTARERRLRFVLRSGSWVFTITVLSMLALFAVHPSLRRWILVIAPGSWVGAMAMVIASVKLSEAHMDGRKLGVQSRWKFCPKCEYDLTPLPDEGECPECGGAFKVDELQTVWTSIYERLEEKPGR